ncbi:MAG: OmpA family protein [Bacteroidales bacterium]|nr:OmpA family protein [Bacteroidales bacterium]MCF8388541.1 OmpA family protein [Bacteroidales bacterium]MCF8397619.1 OmpA family protein [Bacteroidales bacterium]
MKKLKKRTKSIVILWCLSFLMISTIAYAQQTKSALFVKADKARLYAQQMQADILVPLTYNEGVDSYKDAEKSFNKDKDVAKVEASLVEAVNYFKQAVDLSASSRIVFANTLDARADALSAGANAYAKELWKGAEQSFYEAAKELENGDKDDAYKYSKEAMEIYRKAELASIKTDLLDETRALLEKADDLKVDRNAPKTLEKATSLLAETEKELETNRYDMDYPRILAKQAKYEARHAIYLNSAISEMNDNDLEMEDVILHYETPLTRIVEKAGFVAHFDEGLAKPENKIINYVDDLQERNKNLLAQNFAKDYKIMQLESSIALLKKESDALNRELERESIKRSEAMKVQMKKFEDEKAILDAKIERQKKLDDQFEEVYRTFNSTEASVLRSENNVIIRMHGFGFDIGKSEIKPDNFPLLTKVQNAIKIFPGSAVIVEGYTDSFGGDASNLKLSQDRSDAVTKYLNANSKTTAGNKITSVGYGEINPIANNETKEGRKQNRRIDIIIQPVL